jgi:hypothetical protein
MRLTLGFLLVGFAAGFFLLSPGEIFLIFVFALKFRGSSFVEGDGHGLAPAFHLSAFSSAAALEFAVFEFVHDAAHDFTLAWFGVGHVFPLPCFII